MNVFSDASPVQFAAVATVGVLGGWLFYRIWRRLVRHGESQTFWVNIPVRLKSMVATEDPSEMLRQYRELLTGIARYTVRNLIAVTLAALPIAVLWLGLETLVLGAQPSGVDRSTAIPYMEVLDLWLCLFATIGSIAAACKYRNAGKNSA